jgi:hypothetical protein
MAILPDEIGSHTAALAGSYSDSHADRLVQGDLVGYHRLDLEIEAALQGGSSCVIEHE